MTATTLVARAAITAAAVVVAACTPSSPGRRGPLPRPRPDVTATTGPTVVRPPRAAPRHVGFRTVTVVDTAAGTPARGTTPPRHDRMLPTAVWYPAVAAGPASALRGPFPLVVFAHGFDVTPYTYDRLLRQVAAAGFVVAAPLFPISAAGLPGRPREDDIANQALDVRATISTLLALGAGHGWLAGRLDPHEVAVMGHSDGGETVAANVLVAADHDPRVRAAVILAGQLPTWGVIRPAAIPALVVQGSADTINPPILSRDVYRLLRHPKWYLDVVGGTHLPAVVGGDRRAQTVRAAVIAFLDATVRRATRARALLARFGNEPGITKLTVG
jgi:predicted dienelactone hydrolase